MELIKVDGRRLGRIRPAILPHNDPSPKILKLKNYLDVKKLPPLKPYRDWMKGVRPKLHRGFGMMLNDQLGDCTCAAVGHWVQILTGAVGEVVTPTDAQILKMYEASGYIPGQPDTDQGWLIQEALKYWRNKGLAGHTIAGMLAIDPHDPIEIDYAIELFGAVNIGIGLPISAQGQSQMWTVPTTGLAGDGNPGSWGGHSVIVPQRTPNLRRLITWGHDEWMISKNAWSAYVSECWTVFSDDWLENGKSPDGFSKGDLIQDWKQL